MKTSQGMRAPTKSPRRSRSEWLEEVTRWRASGEDAVGYGKRHGVHPRTLAWWASQLREELARRAKSAPQGPRMFVAVRETRSTSTAMVAPTGAPRTVTVEIALANGVCVRVFGEVSGAMLAAAVAAAQGAARC